VNKRVLRRCDQQVNWRRHYYRTELCMTRWSLTTMRYSPSEPIVHPLSRYYASLLTPLR